LRKRQWTVDTIPVLVAESDPLNPTQTLYRVVGAHPLSENRIAVGNAGSGEILIFDRQGVLVSVWGKPGEGPEEFDGMRGLYGCGRDTLIVEQKARVSVVSPDGVVVRSHRTVGQLTTHPAFDLEAVSNDCSELLIASRRFRQPNPGERLFNYPTDLYWASLDSGRRRDIGSFPGAELRAINPGTPMGVRLVFGVEPLWASDGESVYYGPGDRFEVHEYSRRGTLERIVRWSGEREELSREEWKRYSEEREELIRQYPPEEAAYPEPSEYPGLGLKPAYGDLIADDAGNLWVGQYSVPSLIDPDFGSQQWWVFNRDGRWITEVATPRGSRVLSIRGDLVFGLTRSQQGVSRVQVFRIRKGAGAGPT
jgi:hypothetical protein